MIVRSGTIAVTGLDTEEAVGESDVGVSGALECWLIKLYLWTIPPHARSLEPIMFWFNIIKSFINIFREGQTPRQVAGGFALGTLIGFSPMVTLQGLLVWLLILILDVNFSAALLALALCKMIAYVLDPLFHSLGFFILAKTSFLQGLWTSLYNAPLAPLTRFNNTVVMGSFLFAAICFFPAYLGIKHATIAYRTHIHARLEQFKIYKIIDKSKFVGYYRKFRDWKG